MTCLTAERIQEQIEIFDESGFSSGAGFIKNSPEEPAENISSISSRYLRERMKLSPNQTDYKSACLFAYFHNADSLEGILEALSCESPNIRILACEILGECAKVYSREQTGEVKKALYRASYDHRKNENLGSFQCEEDEIMTVGECAVKSLRKINSAERAY